MEANNAKLFYSQLYFLNHRLSTLDGFEMDSVTTAFLMEIFGAQAPPTTVGHDIAL
jgi:hypothetical protein